MLTTKPMNDIESAIDWLQVQMHGLAKEKGWYERERELPELLMLVVSELSEALEAGRNRQDASEKIPEFTALEEEMADAVIRILDMSEHFELRLGEAILAKWEYNKSRPHRHGGKKW